MHGSFYCCLPWIIRFLLVNKSSNCKPFYVGCSRAAVFKSVHNMPSPQLLNCNLLSEMKYSHDIHSRKFCLARNQLTEMILFSFHHHFIFQQFAERCAHRKDLSNWKIDRRMNAKLINLAMSRLLRKNGI